MSTSAGHGGSSQDFDLNLASIIDCFTVIITFLLASASFLSIGILDAGVAASADTAPSNAPPPVNVTIEISKDYSATVRITGQSRSTTTFPANAAQLDLRALGDSLRQTKARWTELNAVSLSADDMVEYRTVVQAMEAIRKHMPVIMLAGF
jgi:biopolymer transport protein ExbD